MKLAYDPTIKIGEPSILRCEFSTARLTGSEFDYIKQHAALVVPTLSTEHKREYESLLTWEKRSNSAKKTVQTKRNRYPRWPANRKAGVK